MNSITFGKRHKKKKKKRGSEVKPDGPRDADVIILGDFPKAEEDRVGKPFIGQSGTLMFDHILGQEGIFRDECLVLHTFWKRPQFDNYERTTQEEREYYKKKTWAIINKHPRKLIIPTGNLGLKLLTGDSYIREKKKDGTSVGIHKLRGSPLRSLEGHRVIPVIHPSTLLGKGQYKNKAYSLLDAAKCRRFIDYPERETPVYSYTTWAGLQERITRKMLPRSYAFSTLKKKLRRMRHSPVISFDIETYPKGNPTITVIGLTDHIRRGVSIPFTGELTREQEVELIGLIKEILEGPALKVAQNVEFDAHFLAKLGIGIKNFWMDTMLAHSCLHPELAHSLEILTSIYTDQPYYKDMVKTTDWGKYNKTLWEYNVIDVCVTLEIAYKLFEEMQTTRSTFPYIDERFIENAPSK